MIKNIISLVLLVASAGLNFKHGWDSINIKNHPESAKMMSDLGISETYVPLMAGMTILVGLLLLFPKTFFLGNLLNAITIVTIMALALNSGNYKIALMEIPFFIMPLVMIWLKYPFRG